MRVPRRTRGSPRGSRRFAGRIAAVRATRLASRGRRRRRGWHAAAVSGARSRPAFLKTPRSRASHARDRARGDALERARGSWMARDVRGIDTEHTPRPLRLGRRRRSPLRRRRRGSAPAPARIARATHAGDAGTLRRVRARRATPRRASRVLLGRVRTSLGHGVCFAVLTRRCCARSKRARETRALPSSPSRKRHRRFLLFFSSLKILESLDPRIRGVLEAHFRRFFCT